MADSALGSRADGGTAVRADRGRPGRDAHAAARALVEAGDLRGAEAAYAAILMRNPRDAQAWHLLGWICQSAKRIDEAADHYRQSLRFDADNPPAWNNLAAGSYVLEVSRTRPGDTTAVRGTITVRVVGETRSVPFVLTGQSVEVGRVETSWSSRLVPAW